MGEKLEQWRTAGRFFRYRGHNVFWREAGQGSTLILLHGFPTASYDWSWIWDHLSDRFRVVALDLLGYGFSDKPAGYAYSVFDHADQVEALSAELKLEAVGVLAHDYGDTVAQELLARHNQGPPGRKIDLQFVGLLNGGIFPGVHRPTLILKLLKSPLGFVCSSLMTEGIFRGRMREIFGKATQPAEEALNDWWTLVNHQQGRKIYHKLIRYMDERWRHRERWVGALKQTSVPLRLINGAADPISGQHLADHYRRVIPGADVISLDGIGHYPQVEAPGRVVEAFLDWQATQPATR